MQLSVVIPVFRSSAWLPELVARVIKTLDNAGMSDYEIVLVDDGSPDDTWGVIDRLCQTHPRQVTAVQLMRNFGQHNALMCGLRHAQGELIVTMDDDLQNPPEEIPKLLAAIRQGDLDVVYGQYRRKRQAPWRNALSAPLFKLMHHVFETKVSFTSFRVLRREVVEALLSNWNGVIIIDGLICWHTGRIGTVTVRHDPRRGGRSSYSLGRLVRFAVNLFANFSLLPLQVSWATGLLALLTGIGLLAYALLAPMLGSETWPALPTMIVVLILGGVQLTALGMLGEYVGRLLLHANRRPQYTVRQVIRHHQPSDQQALDLSR